MRQLLGAIANPWFATTVLLFFVVLFFFMIYYVLFKMSKKDIKRNAKLPLEEDNDKDTKES